MLEIQKKLTNTFYVLISLPATAMGFALSVQISALSWLLSTRYGLDIHEIGLVWAAGPLAGILGQITVGMISDRVWFWGGRRRPFILLGAVCAAGMLFLLPRIDGVSELLGISNIFVVAVGIALTLDLSINISFNPTRSLIADLTPEGHARTRGYTWMQTISGFWGVMAYVIGAAFGNVFLIGAGVVIVLLFSVIPTLFAAEPRNLTEPGTNEATRQTRVTDWKRLATMYSAHGFSWIGVQTMFVYIIAYIQQKLVPGSLAPDDSAAHAGQIIAIAFAVLNTVGFLLPATVLEPLARRIGRIRTHIASIVCMAVGYFIIALTASTPMALYLLMAVVGIGWGAVVSLPFAIMSESVEKRRMGLFMGVFNLSVVIPQLLVSLGLGIVILHAPDKSIIFHICGSSVAISALLWFFVGESPRQSASATAPYTS